MTKKHPCLKFGPCKFGPTCKFASYPISACVFYLRGHCTNHRCRFDHVKEYDFVCNSEAAQQCLKRSENFELSSVSQDKSVCTKKRLRDDEPIGDLYAIQHFGNYPAYYRCRTEDSRIQLLLTRKDILQHRTVMDVGCNIGEFTIKFAQKFECIHVLGIDKDPNLIQRALQSLQSFILLPEEGYFPVSAVDSYGILPPLKSSLCDKLCCPVKFVAKDFAESAEDLNFPWSKFEIILCLSVTKWVHLEGGDQALMRLFHRIYSFLEENGVFILEPQPWVSYKKKSNLYSSLQRENMRNIKLRPQHFSEYLISTVGFKRFEKLLPHGNPVEGCHGDIENEVDDDGSTGGDGCEEHNSASSTNNKHTENDGKHSDELGGSAQTSHVENVSNSALHSNTVAQPKAKTIKKKTERYLYLYYK